MVAKCANPSCGASFQYLRGGKLFLVDVAHISPETGQENGGQHAAEYFWLCGRCSSELTVTVDGKGRAAVAKAHATRCR